MRRHLGVQFAGAIYRPKGGWRMTTLDAFVTKVALAFALLLLTFHGPELAAQQFTLGATYGVGTEPQTAVFADFNNDGKPDLATADFTSTDISILLGNGDGAFQPAKQFTVSQGPSAIALGDFNRDGKLDIAVTEYGFGGHGQLAIFLGKGDGSFEAGPVYSVDLPYSVTAADFNGDGLLDLAVADNATNKVFVFLGRGDGTFTSPVSYHAPLPERVLAVDLNGDGHPDLAILAYCGPSPKLCPHGAVEVLLNTGSGTFGKPHYFGVGIGPDGIAAGDLNRDGKVDLVVANNNFQSASTVSVLLGDGTFKRTVNYNAGAGPAGVAIADFNGDGYLDIAVANIGDSTLSVLFGQGNGKFGTAQPFAFQTGTAPISVAAAKLRTGHGPDLAVALDYANQVAILLNKN
jgi:hypothetical protein